MGSIGALSTTGFLGLIGRLAHDRITGRIDVANQDQSLSLFCQNGKLVSISSPFLDRWFLRSTEAKGLLDPDETRALQHLAERQHLPLTSLLMKEGVLNGNQWLDLAQECAETFSVGFRFLTRRSRQLSPGSSKRLGLPIASSLRPRSGTGNGAITD